MLYNLGGARPIFLLFYDTIRIHRLDITFCGNIFDDVSYALYHPSSNNIYKLTGVSSPASPTLMVSGLLYAFSFEKGYEFLSLESLWKCQKTWFRIDIFDSGKNKNCRHLSRWTGKFYQTTKEEWIPILLKLFQHKYCWIQFGNILLISASVFILIVVCNFLVISLSSFDIRVILVS